MTTERLYAVDQVRGRTATLIDDEEHRILVPTSRLPRDLKEGNVLRVPVDAAGTPDWGWARIDQAEALRRKKEARDVLGELKERDPGGDVDL